MKTDPGIALMLRVRQDDQAAFGLFYGHFHRRVHYFFYGLCGNSPTSKDLTQETFLRIWKYRRRYAATGSILAYVLTFARFVWLEHCRHLRRHGQPASTPVDEFLSALCAPASAGPESRACTAELSDLIVQALTCLPDDQRMAFVLQTVQGMTAEESASVMQCPVHTARSRKILAVKKLRVSLQEVWSAERTTEKSSEVR